MKIRVASFKDKEKITKFLKEVEENSYILKVLDEWLKNGIVQVVEENDKIIAMNHFFIQNKNIAWLEGARVHKEYRNKGIATMLANKSLEILKEMRIKKARLATSSANIPAQRHLAKTKFKVYSKWLHWKFYEKTKVKEVKIKCNKEIKKIWNYLINSKTFKESGKLYHDSWVWYDFYYNLLKRKIDKLIFYRNGIAIFDNMSRYKNLFQTLYLDINEENYEEILNFILSFAIKNNFSIKDIHIFTPKNEKILKILNSFNLKLRTEILIYEANVNNF